MFFPFFSENFFFFLLLLATENKEVMPDLSAVSQWQKLGYVISMVCSYLKHGQGMDTLPADDWKGLHCLYFLENKVKCIRVDFSNIILEDSHQLMTFSGL